ncbi:hypothetical protein SH449x_003876 [Pirellulaceae bacterium SH449]
MSRAASILGNALWLGLSAVVLLYPCLPARDPNGEVFALSRFDFALVYLANPEALLLQWTADVPLDFWPIRGSAILIATVWCGTLSLLGFACFRPFANRLFGLTPRSLAYWSMSLVLGYALLQGALLLQLTFLGKLTTVATFGLMIGALLAIYLATNFLAARSKSRESKPSSIGMEADTTNATDGDRTLAVAWKRRLYGLSMIGSFYLVAVYIVGAMVPSVDLRVREERWVYTAQKYGQYSAPGANTDPTAITSLAERPLKAWRWDPIAYTTLGVMGTNIRSTVREAVPIDGSGQLDTNTVPASYTAFIASKLVAVMVGLAGLLLFAHLVSGLYGRAPAMLLLFLLLTTPSLLELARAGRPEFTALGPIAVIVTMFMRYQTRRRGLAWPLITLVSLALWGWLSALSMESPNVEQAGFGTILRFAGISSLFAIPWTACIVIGLHVKPSRKSLQLFAVGISLFVLLGILLACPDRCWIPVLGLFIPVAAHGIAWLLVNQHRFIGIVGWGGMMVIGLVNASYWPLMENRLLAPVEFLVSESWREYPSDQTSEVRIRYPLELRRQFYGGALADDAIILLLGTRDDLDIPLRCRTIESQAELTSGSIEQLIELSGSTHVALVASLSGEEDSSTLTYEQYKLVRAEMEELERRGKLQRLPVSQDNFDLIVYQLVR